MDLYYPAGQEDIDQTAIADEVWDLACVKHNTNDPADDQLHEAEAELTAAWEDYEAKCL